MLGSKVLAVGARVSRFSSIRTSNVAVRRVPNPTMNKNTFVTAKGPNFTKMPLKFGVYDKDKTTLDPDFDIQGTFDDDPTVNRWTGLGSLVGWLTLICGVPLLLISNFVDTKKNAVPPPELLHEQS